MKYNAPYGSIDPSAPYTNGNPATGTAGSIPPAAAVEDPQRELVNLISKAGLTPSETDKAQATRAVRSGKLVYAAAAGTANALTVTLDPIPAAGEIAAGLDLLIKIATANTGPATLNVNGLGPVAIKDMLGNALTSGALAAGSLVRFGFDGTSWQVQAVPGSVPPVISVFTDTTPGTRTFTPTSTGWYQLELCGSAGGGGGGVGSGGGGGGGAGGRAIDFVYLTAGTSYTYTVGSGGAGGNAGFDGIPGGASSFVGPGGTVVATGGGGGGGAGSGIGGLGSSGGVGSGHSARGVATSGQGGFQGSPQISQSGQGGSSPGGGFGGQASFGSGNPGTAPGGGGSGGTGGNLGGAGANGHITLQALGV